MIAGDGVSRTHLAQAIHHLRLGGGHHVIREGLNHLVSRMILAENHIRFLGLRHIVDHPANGALFQLAAFVIRIPKRAAIAVCFRRQLA
ncbi:hypothetical protein D3C76_988490 [compost metagenome]